MRITADNWIEELYINEELIKLDPGPARNWQQINEVEFEVKPGRNVIAVHCGDSGVIAGLLADITFDKTVIVTDRTWKCTTKPGKGWHKIDYDEGKWEDATEYAQYPQGIWGARVNGMGDPPCEAFWIWTKNNAAGNIDTPVYFRYSWGKLSVEAREKLSITWGEIKRINRSYYR
jgi:hypothetical protein